ncbi:hypothetical protein CL622_07690 [archaeon]|nr:hypothetical protein [archaeon]|tara:strand:+ start:937 stop:1131 length:195 start_codon:yes stop_codon:yes gene_type:complete
MSEDIKNELADLGFQLVDIKDKEWLLIADQEGFANSCILLNNADEIDDVIELHKQVSKDSVEMK